MLIHTWMPLRSLVIVRTKSRSLRLARPVLTKVAIVWFWHFWSGIENTDFLSKQTTVDNPYPEHVALYWFQFSNLTRPYQAQMRAEFGVMG